MADITTTVNGMPKADTSPTPPAPVAATKPTLTATQIKNIAKELAQPWTYGTALHRFADRHGAPLVLVQEIAEALQVKQAADSQ